MSQKKSPDNNHPPKWATRFLEWYCHPDLLEEIQGDIFELFANRVEKQGFKTARKLFVWDVLRFFRPSVIKKPTFTIHPIMWQNYFKTTFRNLLRNRQYSLLNMFGLALGIACFLLIFFHLKDELSYEQPFQTRLKP